MKKTLINIIKTLLVLIVFPLALAAVGIFMLITFAKMGAAALFKHGSISAR